MDGKIRVNLAGKTITCLFFFDMRSRELIEKSENSFLAVSLMNKKWIWLNALILRGKWN
ncbi:hypothetical protein [Bacillus pseudomycoides]|uniref:hypothetical protein n=1 Tax=Bacillus pseudomycoides TaxID=64104 RepID=UPI0015D4F54F|nr:hypothetical protein [Bacillus pseudomycoides]